MNGDEVRVDRAETTRGPGPAPPAIRVLEAVLLAVWGVQLLCWLPHYVQWPYWADHDAFATAARAWTRGGLPYRDVPGNNFPGTIYLLAVLGTLFGWGRPEVFLAFDALLQTSFAMLLLVWSRRCLGRVLPGAIGVVAVSSVLMALDYSHAAQRDGQAPLLGLGGILLVHAIPGAMGRVATGLLAALALAIRPQSLLFLPAMALAACLRIDGGGVVAWEPRRLLPWIASLVAGTALLFAPLILAGIVGDFLAGVRLASYGGAYNRVTPLDAARAWLLDMAEWRYWVVLGSMALLIPRVPRRVGRLAIPWLVALMGASFYKPLSPVPHSYLEIPLALTFATSCAMLSGIAMHASVDWPSRVCLLLLALGCTGALVRPAFCVPGPAWRAARSAWTGTPWNETPPGYRHGSVPTSAFYPWRDYLAVLSHLRESTTPETPLANLLMGDPAITSMLDRPSALPTESLAWLRMVRPGDEARFAKALERAPGAVVVWVPNEVGPDPAFRIPLLERVVRRDFAPSARFGVIEVWRRKTRS